jgi:tetratricopeptide (TPR) repeat protein
MIQLSGTRLISRYNLIELSKFIHLSRNTRGISTLRYSLTRAHLFHPNITPCRHFQPNWSQALCMDRKGKSGNRMNRRSMSTTTEKSVIMNELNQLKKKLGQHYGNGEYKDALDIAIEMHEKISRLGTRSAHYASSLNNLALLNKYLGNNDTAIEQYTQALIIYHEIYGTKSHLSYASTLTNLGILYKTVGEQSSGLDRMSLYDRAEEALSDALATRKELLGENYGDTLFAAVHLAGVWRLQKKLKEAEVLLSTSLTKSKEFHGGKDLLAATILNSLGLLLKSQGRYAEAKLSYEQAFEIRRYVM